MSALPFTCPACGEQFGYGMSAPLLSVVAVVSFSEPAPCCGARLTGTLHRDGTVEFDGVTS